MIKCYIVQNVDNPPLGVFKPDKFYIAKISNNNINTFAILDEKQNWVPFNCRGIAEGLFVYKLYFSIFEGFYVKNKKELNEYIESTKLYN